MKKYLGSGDRISTGIHRMLRPIDGKEYDEKRNAAKARIDGLKKPSPSSNPK
jgi:hypothetical protein